MTDAEVLAVQRIAVTPAQRLIVALVAVHAARATAIRHLTLDDLDLPNRRITIAGHGQRLGELPHRTMLGSLTGARVLAEIGDDRARFATAGSLKAYAGSAPVTRASGKSCTVMSRRVKNQRFAAVGSVWAFASLTSSPGMCAMEVDRRRGNLYDKAARLWHDRSVALPCPVLEERHGHQ